jgi:hypothetical protein
MPGPEAGASDSGASRSGSTRPVGAGDRILAQGRNIVRSRVPGGTCQPRLFQILIDLEGCPVSPANHGEPTQEAREYDKRRHRSILLIHAHAPNNRIVAQAGPACNRLKRD